MRKPRWKQLLAQLDCLAFGHNWTVEGPYREHFVCARCRQAPWRNDARP